MLPTKMPLTKYTPRPCKSSGKRLFDTCLTHLENLALRRRLSVLHRSVKKPKLTSSDRLLWAWLCGAGSNSVPLPSSSSQRPLSDGVALVFVSTGQVLPMAPTPQEPCGVSVSVCGNLHSPTAGSAPQTRTYREFTITQRRSELRIWFWLRTAVAFSGPPPVPRTFPA